MANDSSAFEFFNKKFDIFDFVKLGAIQFTLILGASSAAKATVKPSTPALEDEIILWLENPYLAATVENNTTDPLFLFKLSWKVLTMSVAATRFRS